MRDNYFLQHPTMDTWTGFLNRQRQEKLRRYLPTLDAATRTGLSRDAFVMGKLDEFGLHDLLQHTPLEQLQHKLQHMGIDGHGDAALDSLQRALRRANNNVNRAVEVVLEDGL